jgi:hypothetical protein
MRGYATQMEAARKGIVTEELKKVAEKELMTAEELMPLVAAGKVVICANKNHKCIDPQGVGSMLKTKINVNLGVSIDCKDYAAYWKHRLSLFRPYKYCHLQPPESLLKLRVTLPWQASDQHPRPGRVLLL